MENSSRYSVVIPTLWKPLDFPRFVSQLSKCEDIGEIIIISNNPNKIKTFRKESKIRVINLDGNIGVNPAWNLGVKEAKYSKIAVINDDITFNSKVFKKVTPLLEKDSTGIVGLSTGEEGDYVISPTEKRQDGFGCMFFIDKGNYTDIPNPLKIFFGDDWLFKLCQLKGKKNYVIKAPIKGEMATSSKAFNHIVLHEFKDYINTVENEYTHNYRFSIIVTHYDGVITDDEFIRGMDSIEAQGFKDFEVLVYHDGTCNRDLPKGKYSFPIKTVVTPVRYNDWGHSLRNLGVFEARGEYILFLNADNTLYPHALQEIDRVAKDDELRTAEMAGTKWNSNNIIIFPILLKGQTYNGFGVTRHKGREDDLACILTGYPPQTNFIDCMQLVMRRSKWEYYNGWYDKSFASDGIMYGRFVHENLGARYCDSVLGEHN